MKAGLIVGRSRSVNRQLNLLSLILGSALKKGKIRANPVALVDRPPEPRRRWKILTPIEIQSVERALDDLIEETGGEEQAWRRTCRGIFPCDRPRPAKGRDPQASLADGQARGPRGGNAPG